jgi:predicted nucleic acid-binding protein
MILVDSSVWINYFNGIKSRQTDFLDDHLVNTPIIIGDLILVEVLQGFRNDRDFNKAKSCFDVLEFHQMGGYDIAIKSAQNYRLLRKKGITVRKTIDVIIATFCIMNNLTLLHDDQDFDPLVLNLQLHALSDKENWN